MEGIGLSGHLREAHKDEWHSVQDAKKRKQIQDRLAQRTRRKRLREAKHVAEQELPTRSMTSGDSWSHVSKATSNVISDTFNVVQVSTNRPHLPPSNQSFTLDYELPVPLTVFTALYLNGRILGLTCGTPTAAKSPPVSPHVPLPLQPTPTQQLIVHFNGFDRFPFPEMRDSCINMSALLDEEAFSHDLFTMPSFDITPGAASWDPRAWKMHKAFAEKWGFLFY